MKRTTSLIVGAALAACMALSGCSSEEDSPTGELLGTVETMFGKVDVPQPADGTLTVVALGWSDAEYALALGIKPVAVFDWQGFGEPNKGVGPWASELFGSDTPTVIPNTGQDLNYEQIQGLAPDVILNVSAASDETVHTKLASITPATVYAPADTPDFATPWEVHMRSIAAALGQTPKGEEVITDVRGQIDQAAQDHSSFQGHTIVSGTKFGEAYGAYLEGDGRFDLLADLGFVQNPPVLELTPSGFFASISAENIEAMDADVSIFLPIGYTLAEIQEDELIASLDSVGDDRAIFIDPESELSGAWSASSVLSIPVVLEQMVPQLETAAGRLPTAS